MPSKSEIGYVRIKERVAYNGKGVDELVGAIRIILGDPVNKYTQKIVMEVGTPYIYLEKLVPEAEQELAGIHTRTLHDAIRLGKMTEIEVDDGASPIVELFAMFNDVRAEGLFPNYVVVGDKSVFQKWLGLRIPARNMHLFGSELHVLGELPPDVFLVCGTEDQVSEVGEVIYSVKRTI